MNTHVTEMSGAFAQTSAAEGPTSLRQLVLYISNSKPEGGSVLSEDHEDERTSFWSLRVSGDVGLHHHNGHISSMLTC